MYQSRCSVVFEAASCCVLEMIDCTSISSSLRSYLVTLTRDSRALNSDTSSPILGLPAMLDSTSVVPDPTKGSIMEAEGLASLK